MLGDDPPHVWHQEVVAPGHAEGYDGVVNDHFLVRTADFRPRGALSDAQLAAEHISGLKWWHPSPRTRAPTRSPHGTSRPPSRH
ncbi:hypothetical protein [Actinacidiphila sp. bgisy144]|uniref:hypothetical protein n=1 Tax=Actinacidiphila sp. bgisy144 TaxID=3413791 RepID=UPI003EB81F0D